MYDLNTPIFKLGRLGQVLYKKLNKLEILNLGDLIFYFPFRHEDFSNVLPISKITPGITATVKGKIDLIANRRSWAKRKILTEALVSDDSGSIKVIWFNQPFLTKILKVGDRVFLSGRVEYDYHVLQFINPIYETIKGDEIKGVHTARIIPIYSLTGNITQKQIRALTKLALNSVKLIKDWLPPEIKNNLRLFDLVVALRQIHFPDNKGRLEAARHRLKFDELFLIQMQAKKLRKELEDSPALKISFREDKTKEFVASLPFKLTEAQRRSAWEILKDLEKGRPMNRLLEGDVGSGKTLVAAIAALNTALNSYQAVFMAPTEILAQQHFNTVSRLLEGFPIAIGLLTRSESKLRIRNPAFADPSPRQARDKLLRMTATAGRNQESGIGNLGKKELLKEISSGKVQIIIGTHALIQEKVKFNNLALIIVDEQHRFGVEQRKTLKEKDKSHKTISHLLSMTATPIPRTLALAFYGDLDLSILDEMPAGRKKVITKIIEPRGRKKTYEFIRKEICGVRQVFVICPLIDPSDKLGVKSVKSEYEKLNKEIFPDLEIGFLHGRLKARDKEGIMREFLNNKINILVSTSVIEVGIDVSNATIMMIEGAERFGLAQLHQFRGRVGRSERQSYCFLFAKNNNEKTKERLEALVGSENGFVLAEKDLEFRGPGEVYGTRQSGLPNLRIATLADGQIIKEAKDEAEKIIKKDPLLINYPDLKIKLEDLGSVHLE
jgi:ATP-dependent DNA helicase RecG